MTEATEEKKLTPAQVKEQEMIEEIRKHLSFVTKNMNQIPTQYISDNYKKDLLDFISKIRWYCSHKYWREEDGDLYPEIPISHIYNAITRKNRGIGYLMGMISGPRLEGWTRAERQAKEMLKACLHRAIHYVPPPEYHPDWLLPKEDPRNTHPAAVRYREEKQLQIELDKKAKHAEEEKKRRKKVRLEKESKERLKLKDKQRKERKKHFEERDEEVRSKIQKGRNK